MEDVTINWKRDSLFIKAMRFTFSLFMVTVLFSVIPITHGFFSKQERTLETVARTAPVVMERKVEEEKSLERQQPNIRNFSNISSSRRMDFSMRFAPDLGLGSGDGISVGGDGIGSNVFDEGEVDEPPKPLTQMAIAYPRSAKQAGIEGTVSLIILIGRTGSVTSVSVESSPSPLFDKPIIDAIKKWKFSPGKNGGVAVKTRIRQNIKFNLES